MTIHETAMLYIGLPALILLWVWIAFMAKQSWDEFVSEIKNILPVRWSGSKDTSANALLSTEDNHHESE